MGTVNVFRGLDTIKNTHSFNGVIKENLSLNWEYVKIYKGSEELTPDYRVKDDDIVLVIEYPQGVTALLVIGIVSLAVGLGVGIYSYIKTKQIEKEMNEALSRIGKTNKQSDVSSIPQLSGGRNEKADGKQSPLIIGKHLFAPYYLSDPYMRPSGVDGEDLYWYGAFVAGQNGLCFEKVRNSATELVALSGDESQRGKYPFQSGAGEAFYDPENFIEIVQKGETTLNAFTEPIFEEKWVDALESTVEIGRKKKEEGAKIIDDIWMEDDGEEPVIRETAMFPMRVEIELFVDGLHGWDSNNGVETEATVEVRIEWSANNGATWETIPIVDQGWDDETLTRTKSKQMRFLAVKDFPASIYSMKGDPVLIKATRLCKMHAGSYRDRVYLSAIRTKQYNPKTSSILGLVPAKNINPLIADKFCRLGIKIKANVNTEGALDKFNIVACMTGRVFENNRWSANKVKTSNPAAVALEILTGLIHEPSRYSDNDINRQSFAELYQYCLRQEVKIEGEDVQPISSLEANGVVTGSTRKIDLLKAVLATCDAGLYMNEYGKFIVYFDDYQSTPVGLLNPQRIVKMSEQRSLARKIDGYKVEFVNEEADWSNDTHRILRPRVALRPGENTYTSIKLEYTTNYYQAMWLTRRMMAREILRPGELKVTVGKEGRHYKPGSLIKVQHERFKIGIGSGEIIEILRDGDLITGFRLMEKFDIASDRDYFIEYYVVDENRNHVVYPEPEIIGMPETKQRTMKLQSVGEYTNVLMLSTPVPADNFYLPNFGDILSVIPGEPTGIAGKIYESKRYLVSDLSETPQGYDLALVQYDEEIYRTTTFDQIPEYKSSIVSTNPKIFTQPDTKPYDGLGGQSGLTTVFMFAKNSSLANAPAYAPNNDNPGNIWFLSPPLVQEEEYLWMIKSEWRADNRLSEWSAPVRVKGDEGDKGDKGDKGDDGEQGEPAPMYRGAYSAPGNAEGVIGWEKMNALDYIMYTGNNATAAGVTWTAAYMYQWTGTVWRRLEREGNYDKYLDGISDLTEGAPEGVFSTAFIRNLFVQTLNAEWVNIRSRLRVGAGADGIQIDGQDAVIQSYNFNLANKTGWKIDKDGNAEFNNALVRGRVEASEGSFTGRVDATSGRFEGEIYAEVGIIRNIAIQDASLRNLVINNGYSHTKYAVDTPAGGALLQDNYTTARLITALDDYFGQDKIKPGGTGEQREFKCSGTVFLRGIDQGTPGAFILAIFVGWSAPVNTWFFRGVNLSAEGGAIGFSKTLNLSQLSNRDFILNLCIG